MSTYTDFAPYLRPEYPKFTETEGNTGSTWVYRYPDSASLTKPVVGVAWADTNLLTSVELTPALDNSGVNELTVSTVYSVTGGGPATTTLEEERVDIQARPQQLPLIQHPAFAIGGTYDLFTDSDELRDVLGWEYEQDAELRATWQYRKLDSNGIPATTATIIASGSAASAYVQLRLLGYDSCTVYCPVFQKVGIYRGQNAPSTSGWGQYITSPSTTLGSSRPKRADGTTEWAWIKTGDSCSKVGNGSRWQRTEEYTGYTAVYFDVDEIDPAGLLVGL